jgi:hypothetical protein
MTKKLMVWALAMILAFGALPLVSLLLAMIIALPLGCRLDEGNVYPCVIFGLDFGTLLYVMAVSGWLAMFTVPVAGLALIVWLIVLVILLVMRRHRRPEAIE